jgi:transcription initiation factor IIF auxiliary subunit
MELRRSIMTVKLSNYAQPTETKEGLQYYRWRVFVDEPADRLKAIKRVIYALHPTFPKPVQVRSNAEDRFSLDTWGWGEFKILVTVEFRDGREEIFEYPLDLSKAWPTEAASA